MSIEHTSSGRRAIGFIMDGNRRFAREHGLSLREAYERGALTLKSVVAWSARIGFTDVVAYAFSRDNLERGSADLESLYALLRDDDYVTQSLTSDTEKPCVRVVGAVSALPDDVQKTMARVESETAENTGISLWLAVAYSGRQDIVHAVAKVTEAGESVTEASLSRYLASSSFPDPEYVIRTGGAQRLSGFLLWEVEYSELLFTKTLWPALTGEELTTLLNQHEVRRNHGR